jgi:hypothetical protein
LSIFALYPPYCIFFGINDGYFTLDGSVAWYYRWAVFNSLVPASNEQ